MDGVAYQLINEATTTPTRNIESGIKIYVYIYRVKQKHKNRMKRRRKEMD